MSTNDDASIRQALTEDDWNTLLSRLENGRCTPFLGGESGFDNLPEKSKLARELAQQYGYLFDRTDDLAHVAQYVAATKYPSEPREWLIDRLSRDQQSSLGPDSPHVLLTGLPFRTFITTAVHDYLLPALKKNNKDPKEDFCRWSPLLFDHPPPLASDYRATVANPLVFRVYGNISKMESLAITEDDYLDFLVNTSLDPKLIPASIEETFARGSLLFFGYRIEDLEFRVLMRRMIEQLRRNQYRKSHLSVQVIRIDGAEAQDKNQSLHNLQSYLSKYMEGEPLYIRTCWTNAVDFLRELAARWKVRRAQ